MEYLIDGVRCHSSVYSIATGDIKDFKPEMDKDVLKSCILRMNAQELTTLPKLEDHPLDAVIVQIRDEKVISVKENLVCRSI